MLTDFGTIFEGGWVVGVNWNNQFSCRPNHKMVSCFAYHALS